MNRSDKYFLGQSTWTEYTPSTAENIFVIKILRFNICYDLAFYYYFTFHYKVMSCRRLNRSSKFKSYYKITKKVVYYTVKLLSYITNCLGLAKFVRHNVSLQTW
jgi:hypothetical protein